MTVPATGAISLTNNIRAEFGGSAPNSLSEYYKLYVNLSDLSSAPNASSIQWDLDKNKPFDLPMNANIPFVNSKMAIKFSQFRGAGKFEYSITNPGDTGNMQWMPAPENADRYLRQVESSISGRARYVIPNVHSFNIPSHWSSAFVKMPVMAFNIQGSFNSGGWFGDDDWSGIMNPGYTVTVGPYTNGQELITERVITHYDDQGYITGNPNWNYATARSFTTSYTGTIYISYHAEGYIDPDAGPAWLRAYYWDNSENGIFVGRAA